MNTPHRFFTDTECPHCRTVFGARFVNWYPRRILRFWLHKLRGNHHGTIAQGRWLPERY